MKFQRRDLHRKGGMLCCMLAILLVSPALSAQRVPGKDTLASSMRDFHHEMPDDQFVPIPPDGMPTSPAYRIAAPNFFSTQVNVDSLGRNIVGDAANEPSIAVDPTNPNRIIIGWRQFNTITSNFRQAGYGYTTDGGITWRFPGVLQPGIFRSDPVFDSDAQGNFYYNSLTTVGSSYRCDVFKSSTGGASWGTPVVANGGDKQWMTIDKSSGIGEGNIYSSWTSSFSFCPPGFFTRSANRGASYESCVVIPNDPYWGTLAVGPAGELYMCGAGSTAFVVAKSTVARDSSIHAVTWDTTSVVNLDGNPVAFAGTNSPNPGGLHGQAWVAVDRSNGSTRGNVYVLCSVARNSNGDPLDVMFARSTNGGRTWSAPVRVNDDISTTAWQWFGTMSVAPTGRIDVAWLDTRDNPGSINSSLYYSYSTNAGATWSPNARLSQAFDPHAGWPQQNKMGDYFHMVSDSAVAHLAWCGTFGGEQNVFYGHISYPLTGVEEQGGERIPVSFSLSQNYPNPFNPATRIDFGLPAGQAGFSGSGFVSLKVYDVLGREVATLVNEEMKPGTYMRSFDGTGIPSGVYFYRLEAGGFTQTKKLVLLR
jgi:hypothetical protein